MIYSKKSFKKTFLMLALLFPVMSFASGQDYKMKGREVLQVSVYNNTDLNTTVRASKSGVISFPLIGHISVLNLSVKEIERKISAILKTKGIVKKPDVNVFIEQYRPRKYTVFGEVNKPGQFEIEGDDPVYITNILSLSAGLTDQAGEKVRIIRERKGVQEQTTVELDSFLRVNRADAKSTEALNFRLVDGDTLYFPKAPHFYIYGAIKNPGAYKVEGGLTLNKALIIAGGRTTVASGDQVDLKREGEEKKRVFDINYKGVPKDSSTVDFDRFKINGEDVLFIPETGAFYVYGEVNKPGTYRMENDISVIKAISIAGGMTDNASSRLKITRKRGDEETTFSTNMSFLIRENDILIVPESLF